MLGIKPREIFPRPMIRHKVRTGVAPKGVLRVLEAGFTPREGNQY